MDFKFCAKLACNSEPGVAYLKFITAVSIVFMGNIVRYNVQQLECPVCGCLQSKKDHTAIKCDEREKAERPKKSSIEGEKEKKIPICLLWGQGDDNVPVGFDFLNQIGHDLPGWCRSPRRVLAIDWLATNLQKAKEFNKITNTNH